MRWEKFFTHLGYARLAYAHLSRSTASTPGFDIVRFTKKEMKVAGFYNFTVWKGNTLG